MLNYNPSALTDNKTLLEKLNEILLYLKENPCYKIYQTTDSYSVGSVFSVQNVIMKEGEKLENKDIILFSNGYIGVVTDLTETTYKIEQAVNINGPQGPKGDTGPQGPKGDAGEIPPSLPQEASALKSGYLTTTGWSAAPTEADIWSGTVTVEGGTQRLIVDLSGNFDAIQKIRDAIENEAPLYAQWDTNEFREFPYKGLESNNESYRWEYETGIWITFSANKIYFAKGVKPDITLYGITTSSALQIKKLFTISDTDIAENSDVLMELTDEGGVKPYSMEAGKMTVIRDTVPTTAIHYTYKVKQTNASGQFTLVNHYVPNIPVTSVNGQTGAVKIAVPTKTSELENDSGYVSNLSTVRNVVCNDVDSATTLDTTITCEVGDLILAQIIVRSALTLPTDWTLLRTIPAVETSVNQTLSFAYKKATSTSETLTVTQATAGRIYTNLVRLSNAVSISYIQSCEKTGTGIKSISSTKPVTSNMVIWGVSSDTWKTSLPYENWTYSPSTLDYYSLPQSTRAPRLGTFIDSSGAGERTFSTASFNGSADSMLCGAVEIVGDEVARKGDIPSATTLYEDSTGAATVTLSETINNGDIVRIKTNNGNVDHYYIGVAWNRAITVTESLMVTNESDVTVGTAINIDSLRFNIQDTSLILFHYFNTNITTAGAVTITNEKANVVIRKVERIHA